MNRQPDFKESRRAVDGVHPPVACSPAPEALLIPVHVHLAPNQPDAVRDFATLVKNRALLDERS